MRLIILATAVALAVSPAAWSQSGSGSGDGPENKGSTGWTGAHPETGGATTDQAKPKAEQGKPATTGQAVQVHDETEASGQPVMATGLDLNGPGKQFAPSQTPE